MAILVTNCSGDKNKIAPCTFDVELRNTSLPIKNVAVDSGFKTSEYFCSVFQETVGMTPRAYRAANDDGARQPETDATKRGA